MPSLLWLLGAFLIGVLIEWALEIFFFRRRMFEQAEAERLAHERAYKSAQLDNERLTAEVSGCTRARAQLEAENAALNARVTQLGDNLNAALNAKTALAADLQTRTTELGDCQARQQNFQADLAKAVAAVASATATLKALENDNAALSKQIADLNTQLDKAKADVATSNQTCAKLQAESQRYQVELMQVRAELARCQNQGVALSGEIANLRTSANHAAANIKTLEDEKAQWQARLANLTAELQICADARNALQSAAQERETEIANLRAHLSAPPPLPLPVPASEYTRLSQRGEDDETPFESVCPQHLSDVKGIGSVFEARLYQAGVGSFWELAQLSDADLTRILQLTDLHASRTDFQAIRQDARRLAKESKSLGRKWSQGLPDDFEPLEGIGHTFEKRLYDAGICTFAALANATVELLDEICHAPAQFKPDYAAWIAQAQAHVTKSTGSAGA